LIIVSCTALVKSSGKPALGSSSVALAACADPSVALAAGADPSLAPIGGSALASSKNCALMEVSMPLSDSKALTISRRIVSKVARRATVASKVR
jgi:hypothetical protein